MAQINRSFPTELSARDFDRQVAEIQIRAAILNKFTALSIPETDEPLIYWITKKTGERSSFGMFGELCYFIMEQRKLAFIMTSTYLLSPVAQRLLKPSSNAINVAHLTGAVLYCDLVGYSRRGAEAIARSERGAEDLRADINATFERLNQQITKQGGEILYYAGDAVAAFWADDGDATGAVATAISVGHAIRDVCLEVNSDFSIKAGVSHGDLWMLDIELDSAGRLPVFCGSALHSISDLEMTSDDIVLSASAKALTGDVATARTQVQPKKNKEFYPDLWVQPYLRMGLTQGEEWLAEFRNANVLFARIDADHVTDHQQAHLIAEKLRACVDAIQKEKGTLLQVCRDDKGLVVIAAWGLPSSSVEDGAERAVVAAQRVTNVGGNAAIAGGKVFSGLIGSAPYMQYVVVGDAINRAAALCVAAPAVVTLDEGTALAVAARFETAQVQEITLKGHQDAAAVYSVISERSGALLHAGGLIGRVQEQRVLSDYMQTIHSGKRTDLAVIADAGFGKSRLLDWTSRNLTIPEDTHLALKGDSIRRAIGYAPIAPLLRDLLNLSHDATLEECHRSLAILPAKTKELHALLNQVLPAQHLETVTSSALTGPGRAEATQDLILQLFALLLPEKSLIMVEDAHWLDSATWQFLDGITRRKDVSLLMVLRPVELVDLPTEAHRFLDPNLTEILTLDPLDKLASSLLAAQAIEAKGLSNTLEDLIFSKAAGHPLFTTALTQTLETRGLIAVEDGYAHLRLGEKSLAGLSIPTEVSGVVSERIGSLSPAEQLTLKTASILGRIFSKHALSDLHPSASQTNVETDLGAIEKTGLIERADDGSWQFQHAIVSDAAYMSLTSDQARKLHARAAETILSDRGEGYDHAATVLIAYHTERAGNQVQALQHLQLAADHARRSYANLEVIEFLTRALALADEKTAQITVAQWQFHMAYAMRAVGQYQRAEDFLTS